MLFKKVGVLFEGTFSLWASLSTKFDFELEFAMQIARQALETKLLSELEEKDETFFTRANATFRSSHQRCSVTKGVLGNFAKFTGKHLCQSLFFNKIELY